MSGIVTAGVIGSAVSGIFGGIGASKAKRAAAREKARLQAKLNNLEANRQEIINPYEGVEDLSALISNPFANLGVATQAAEIQMEESDLALATTLDTLRATGASAGGATALAQAALEQQRQQQLMAEQRRLQQAEVAGEQFVFGTREQREMQELDRTAALLGMATQSKAQAQRDQTAAITGAIGGVAQSIGGGFQAGIF